MIVLFQYAILMVNNIVDKLIHNKKREKLIDNIREERFRFKPPAFIQRYREVFYILTDERWRCQILKLCDFGCGDLGFYRYMQDFLLTDFILVDIDEKVLRESLSAIEHHKPYRIRDDPMVVSGYVGSVADPDYRLRIMDVITVIEVVEHLYPDCLDALPYNIFRFYSPLVVVITTPNADFNVLFTDNPEEFRHHDHKFEWTRRQFQDWSNNIVTRFPDYTVFFSGAGNGPKGTEFLGKCTQIATFVRRDVLDKNYVCAPLAKGCCCRHYVGGRCKCACYGCNIYSVGVCTYYSKSNMPPARDNRKQHFKHIFEMHFRHYQDTRSREEKIFTEMLPKIVDSRRLSFPIKGKCVLPVYDLRGEYSLDSLRPADLARILKKYGYEITEDKNKPSHQRYNIIMDPPEPESEDSSSDEWEPGPNTSLRGVTFPFFHKFDLKKGFIDGDHRVPPEANTEESNQNQNDTENQLESANTDTESQMDTQADIQEEMDVFEDTTSTPSLSSQDNKLHLRRGQTFEKSPLTHAPIEGNKMKLDINRINELDRSG